METKERSYNSVAWFYDWQSHLYSIGKIRAAKASQINELQIGDRALYVGVGSGGDAVLMARRGVNITCIDIAPAMIERSRKRFDKEGVPAEFICGDVMMHDRLGFYDAVTANFFLNIFTEPVVIRILMHLASLLKPGRRLLIADFALPCGNVLSRISQKAYFRIANRFYWRKGLAPLHPIYDYAKYFNQCGLDLVEIKHFPLFKWGHVGYDSITAIRREKNP